MKRSRSLLLSSAAALAATIGCNQSNPWVPTADFGGPGNQSPDLTFVFNGQDGDNSGGGDFAMMGGGPTACGDTDPSCQDVLFDPGQMQKFPLSGDMPADPNASGVGLGRDANGFLVLDQTHASFNYAWTANTNDWSKGTVSKFDTKTVREVARYFSVTCNSLKTGSTAACDGKGNGCCALDSTPQFLNRQAGMPSGAYQAVQWDSHSHNPSRTAIDFNGDMWVANRAVYQQGAQGSVTKIANDISECIDRNHNGKIDTSKDVNGDGEIETDCNGDGQADDIASVKAKPCTNGMPQEFYGLDDECVLMTSNIGGFDDVIRPLALGPGAKDFGPSDVWVGNYMKGRIDHVDGTTGMIKEEIQMPQPCIPPQLNVGGLYGFVIDNQGIGWAALLSKDYSCYWDTKNTKNMGVTRNATLSVSEYGIGQDSDGNIWFGTAGGDATRYTPNRKGNFMDLGQGYYTTFQGVSGNGVAVDSRSANTYFAYYAGPQIYQIPASAVPVPKGQDQTCVPGQGICANVHFNQVPSFGGSCKGVDISSDGNVIATSVSTPGIERVKVDAMGNMTAPDLQSPPMGNNKCPGGDLCQNDDHSGLSPYTYSDFTGYGLRNFTRPTGDWSYVIQGCQTLDPNTGRMVPSDTKWVSIKFTADTPLNTKVTVKARSGNTPAPDQTWGQWIPDQSASPIDLIGGAILTPNAANGMLMVNDGYLEVEADLQTTDKNKTPRLRSVEVAYECPSILM